jgi:hypothetical protein
LSKQITRIPDVAFFALDRPAVRPFVNRLCIDRSLSNENARAIALTNPPLQKDTFMPQDKFRSSQVGSDTPSTTVFSVTPDDANDLSWVTTALNVATHGIIRVTMQDGSIGDLTVQPGQLFPVRVTRVWESGTTATGIVGLT